MTRINSNIPPEELHRLHLIAELREITMVPASLKRSLKTKSPDEIIKTIPNSFRLNAGHVKFFYDKLEFLKNRFDSLVDEMKVRGYTPDISRKKAFDNFDECFYNNWIASENDNDVVRERIHLRIKQKPNLYK